MANKRVEEKNAELAGVSIDDSMENIPMQEIPKQQKERTSSEEYKKQEDKPAGPVNCLRNEKIQIRFVPRPTSMVQNPNHILYGGMSENATRSFVVPRLNSTGIFKNVLTDNEKAFLEEAMGLEPNALSIYRKKDNFWDDSNPMGIGRVTLHKHGNYLDLSIPEDYIKYKILLANSDVIAPSLQALEDRPKATYQFVIVSENAEAATRLTKMDVTKRCYMEYGKIEDDVDTLRTIIELIEGRPLAPRTKLDFLQGKVNDHIQKNARQFLSTITDELLPAKVLIKRCVEAGLISRRGDLYYLRADGTPLCEMYEESTLNNAAKYISSVKRTELKYTLEAKLKQE